MITFNPRDWYWFVGGDGSKLYGSKNNVYVDPNSDPDYTAWTAGGGVAPQIPSEAEIWYYLKDVYPAWMFDGTTFSQPAAGAYTTDQLKAYGQTVRENTAAAGVIASGVPLNTDQFTRDRITNARIAAENDNSYTTTIHGSDGNLYPVTNTDIINISDDVIAFGTNLADTYTTTHQGIDGGTITTLQQIDDAFAGVSRNIKNGKKNHYRGESGGAKAKSK
jgi:hypothetical protein